MATPRAPSRSARLPKSGPEIMKPTVRGTRAMPAHSGVSEKLYPCWGSQMPCSQMISMNWIPPRPMAERNPARTEVVKARIRNSDNRIMGWGTLNSIRTKANRRTTPPMTRRQHLRIGPSHGVPAVGLNAVDDPGQQGDEADGEGDVPQPVDFGGDPDPVVPQLEVGPHRPEQPEGHRDQEDEPPFDRGQDAAEDQADERPRDQSDAVDPHGLAPFVLGEGVGEDGTRVGEQERRTDALPHPHEDDPQRAIGTGHPGDGQQNREHREDGEPEVVHAHAAVHVTDPAEADDQHRGHQHEPHQDPQEIGRVARGERVACRCRGRRRATRSTGSTG